MPLAARLLYSQEPPIPSEEEERESTLEPIHPEVIEKDFEIFYREDTPNTATVLSSGGNGF